MSKTAEIWKDIPGFEGKYQVSDMGGIKSLSRIVDGAKGKRKVSERIMKQACNVGYMYIRLRVDGLYKNLRVHRLMAQAFIPNPENLPYVNHINGIKTDNRIDNLEWVDESRNMTHAIELGLFKPKLGEECHQSVLTENLVKTIKQRFKDGDKPYPLSKELGIKYALLNAIYKGRSWVWVTI